MSITVANRCYVAVAGAAIIPSLDAHIGAPQLGTCGMFYLKSCGNKTLMFFDGCEPEIGCTILIRGSVRPELAKVKKVITFMTYVEYNWRLERSFLMDAFAMPRMLRKKTSSALTTPDIEDRLSVNSEPFADKHFVNERRPDVVLSRVESVVVEGDSDPLRSMAKADPLAMLSPTADHNSDSRSLTRSMSNPESTKTSMADIFRTLLPQLVLSCSPFVELPLPYLLAIDVRSPLKEHLRQEMMFWSRRFKLIEKPESENAVTLQVDNSIDNRKEATPVECMEQMTAKRHPFMTRDLNVPLHKSDTIQSLLADFRARGGSLPKRPFTMTKPDKGGVDIDEEENTEAYDALLPGNHQRLAVLMCAYSYKSNATFCIDPSLIIMEFYRENDISLGAYLEKYCFKPEAACGRPGCSAPQLEHIRKFCHGTGSVQITLKHLKALEQVELAQANIITWSWCTICKTSSPYDVLSTDSWALSFAKYLQLKISASNYVRRAGGEAPACGRHSLFQDHYQYFAYKQTVASFRYSTITVRDIVDPRINSNAEYGNFLIDERLLVVPREDDPGSQIAYAMTTAEYNRKLLEISRSSKVNSDRSHSKAKTGSVLSDAPLSDVLQSSQATLDAGTPGTPLTASFSTAASSSPQGKGSDSGRVRDSGDKSSVSADQSVHVNLEFSEGATKFYFCAYFAADFRRLRQLVLDKKKDDESMTDSTRSSTASTSSSVFLSSMHAVEDMYTRSLATSVQWAARGGKSGMKFCKSANDRFVLKEMSKIEHQSFMNLASSYFNYIESCVTERRPTLLAKIFGVYRISHKNQATNTGSKMYVIVMENVFYNRTICQKFDLKGEQMGLTALLLIMFITLGSERNRLADLKTQEDAVLLDENLIRMIRDSPLYVRPHSKRLLRQAVYFDSMFLSQNAIMDYSLLVGIDDERRELVLGIIDYVR